MRLLFVHQNFPGQYKHLAAHFGADARVEVVALGDARNIAQRPAPPGVRRVAYQAHRSPGKETHPYLRTTEAAVLRGQAVARAALALRDRGFVPDVICAHPGWGEALYLRDVFPGSRILNFYEFYYRGEHVDVGFDPEFPASLDDRLRIRTWNMVQQSSFFAADWGISPTHWQASVYPGEMRARMSVIHDGIDTQRLRPQAESSFAFADGRRLSHADEVITFVSRGLEPYRGFHVFMRALPELMRRRPKARVVVVGGDTPSYGRKPEGAAHWREKLLAEVGGDVDATRLHFVGKLPYPDFVALLRSATAHVYLSYPFVLSWSMLEAMALGTVVVASDTAPVREVITHEVNGLLFDFFDRQALVASLCRVLDDVELRRALAHAGRASIFERYDLAEVCLPRQIELIRNVATSPVLRREDGVPDARPYGDERGLAP